MLAKFYAEYLEHDTRLHIHGRADVDKAKGDLRAAEQKVCAYLQRQGGIAREGQMVFVLEECSIEGEHFHYFHCRADVSHEPGDYTMSIERRARAVTPTGERRQHDRRRKP